MRWEMIRQLVHRSFGLVGIFGMIACMVCSSGALAEDDNVTYTFYELGYESSIFMEQETVSIEFNSPYERSDGTIDVHVYNDPGCIGCMDLKLNEISLLGYEDINGGGQWIHKDVPLGLIKKGANKIIIGFPYVSCNTGPTLMDDSYIRLNNSNAEEHEDLPGAKDLQLFAPENNNDIGNPTGNGPDLAVTYLEAIGARVDINAGDFIPVNDIVFVNFTVTNIGNDAVTENFTTKIYVNDTNKIEFIDTPHLDAGESVSRNVSYTAPFAILKVKPVIVFADADYNVTELNEENNVIEKLAAIVLA